MRNLKFTFYVVLSFFLMTSCDPSIEGKTALGALPSPSFEIIPGADANTFILRNTTPDVFLANWSIAGVGNFEGDEQEVVIDFMGEYPTTLTVFNQGGSASVTRSIIVTENNSSACQGNFELLTNCGTKTWVLAQEEGALNVGPSVNETWWGNSTDDLSVRECHFNDEYIFSDDGSFEYRNNGDFWADDDGSGNVWPADLGLEVGCNPSDSWPSNYSAWDSGIHSFNINETNLTVSGMGAWIGLYKVGSTAEVMEPQSSVSYSIAEISENRLVLFADLGGVVWRFTLTAQ